MTTPTIADVVAFLEENASRKVSSVLTEVSDMLANIQPAKATRGGNGKNFVKDAEGNVIAVFCYYHKTWELVANVPYGKKASNASTGLNTMCKQGVSKWTKQQREFVKAKDVVFEQLMSGDITADQAKEQDVILREQLKAIEPISEDLAEFCSDDVGSLLN